MKVLMINGSPRRGGNTSIALGEMVRVFDDLDIDTEIIQIGGMDVRGCMSCYKCKQTGKCIIDDIVNEAAPKLAESDGLVVASPVYYANTNGTVLSFMERLFFSSGAVDKTMKVGAAVSVARRGGNTCVWDEINKFYGISGMPIATGQYWNGAFGREKGEAEKDDEGLQQMRTLARNMAFLMKSIALGKEEYGIPEKEPYIGLNFIR